MQSSNISKDALFFENDLHPQWFVALDDKPLGPMSAKEIYEKVLTQDLSWTHLVWRAGMKEWMRICEVEIFQGVLPKAVAGKKNLELAPVKASSPNSVRANTPPPAPHVNVKNRFLYFNESQFGPFTFDEVDRALRIGKIHGRVFIWQEGFVNWKRLDDVREFEEAVTVSRKVRTQTENAKPASKEVSEPHVERRQEKRTHPRKPLIARIVLAHENRVIVGMCRDISVGGMQVLTELIPEPVGSRIRLNVSPADEKLKPFVAEGIIVRTFDTPGIPGHLDSGGEGCGFSFRFEKLSKGTQEAIEAFIASAL